MLVIFNNTIKVRYSKQKNSVNSTAQMFVLYELSDLISCFCIKDKVYHSLDTNWSCKQLKAGSSSKSCLVSWKSKALRSHHTNHHFFFSFKSQ